MRGRRRLLASLAVALIASACGSDGGSFTVDAERVGGLAWDGTLADAIETFGEPPFMEGTYTFCTLRWPGRGIAMETSVNPFVSDDPCVDIARHRSTTVRGERWRTSAGLRIGDPLERLHELYPDAQEGIESDSWWLSTRSFAGLPFASLEAIASDGRVVAFTVHGPRQPQ